LALPFILILSMPLVYWLGRREARTAIDRCVMYAAYVAMGWLSFLFSLSVVRDLVQGLAYLSGAEAVALPLREHGALGVTVLATLAVALGAWRAWSGERIREIVIPVQGLPQGLNGFRIVQISDLHVGPMIRRPYVERVTRRTLELKPDLIALTGDIIDGPLAELRPHVEPLRALARTKRAFFCMGNHEYYAGAADWIPALKEMGIKVLQNEHELVAHGDAQLIVGGVLDPAVRMFDESSTPDPVRTLGDAAQAAPTAFRLLLAHNPKLAEPAAKAGWHLQLSGHTHAGQFLPWTLVTRWVHKPHFHGYSRAGDMHVYVSAGTGTWGPPVRLGSTPELTVLKLTALGERREDRQTKGRRARNPAPRPGKA
jgi:predicted MPP superfamily phosphohydrolase